MTNNPPPNIPNGYNPPQSVQFPVNNPQLQPVVDPNNYAYQSHNQQVYLPAGQQPFYKGVPVSPAYQNTPNTVTGQQVPYTAVRVYKKEFPPLPGETQEQYDIRVFKKHLDAHIEEDYSLPIWTENPFYAAASFNTKFPKLIKGSFIFVALSWMFNFAAILTAFLFGKEFNDLGLGAFITIVGFISFCFGATIFVLLMILHGTKKKMIKESWQGRGMRLVTLLLGYGYILLAGVITFLAAVSGATM